MPNGFRPFKIWIKNQLKKGFFYFRFACRQVFLSYEIGLHKRRKKIYPVVLCIANPGSIGGSELQIQIIAENLKKRLGECLVLVSGKIEKGRSNLFLKQLKTLGIPFFRLGIVGLTRYDLHPLLKEKTVDRLSHILKGSQICHFFNPSSTVLTPVMKQLGLSIYYMETGMPTLQGWWKILRGVIDDFHCVTSVSAAGLGSLKLHYGYKGPSCVTPSMFHRPSRSFFAKEPVSGVFDLVYFGRMTRGKGIDLLIEAFEHLIQKCPYATLSLIGSGERVFLYQKRVEEGKLSDRVRFTPWLQNEALYERLVQADLFCLPSFSEGMPCSILEAMSIGLPVVATNVGGVAEIIEDQVSGILIPPNDQERLNQALVDLAHDPIRRKYLRENALRNWEKMGTQKAVMDQLMIAYRKRLSNSE